jgi:hypothetical protein
MSSVQNEGAKNASGRPDRRGLLWDTYVPDHDDTGSDAFYAFGHTGYTGTAIRFWPAQRLFAMALANRTHPEDKGSAELLRRTVWRTALEAWLGIGEDYPSARSPAVRLTEPVELLDGLALLHVPAHFALGNDSIVDLVVHFHGGADVVKAAADASGLRAALVTVQRNGLSSVYEKPFKEDPALFQRLLDEALAALKDRGQVPKEATLGRVALTSFSAGYGAIRAILSNPAYESRINAVVLADSLYCGYENGRQLSDANMAPFRRFAEAAGRGEKLLVVSHSAQVPDGYAGTTETADDLLRTVGVERTPAAGDWPDDFGPFRPVTQAHRRGLHVLGYPGQAGEDHLAHLRNIHACYSQLAAHLARP